MRTSLSFAPRRRKHRIDPIRCSCLLALTLPVHAAGAALDAPLALTTTEDLYRVCTTTPDNPQQRESLDLCEGFLIGSVSYHDAITDRTQLKRLICYPSTATRDDAIKAFVDWAAHHQQDGKFMNDPAAVGVVRALAAKWPCH